jgi:hypothetical protein
MDYTILTHEFIQSYEAKLEDSPLKPSWGKIRTLAKQDPSIFSKWYLGIVPFHYQDQVLNDFSKRMIVCSSRQIGKTYVVAIKALHYAMFNPNKKVLVFSRNQNQSKKFLRQMRQIMYEGMQHYKHLTDKSNTYMNEEPQWMFPQDFSKTEPNNSSEFSLTNGSTIMSLPATDSARGFTGDLVIVDEAGHVPDEIFELVIEPTVRFTGGTIILLSTPNGQKGFFYDIFDPSDKREEHEYTRYWWQWELCPNENIKKMTEERRKTLDPMRFSQEYEAQFTSDSNAFFQARKVKEAIDSELQVMYGDLEQQYVCGVDYGVTKSKTVVTLCRLDEARGDVILCYQKTFPGGYDNAQLPQFLNDLETRFNITKYVVDDCPQGESPTQSLERAGKPVRRVYFGTEKVGAYFRFRTALNKRNDDESTDGYRVRYPDVRELINEMLALQIKDSRSRAAFLIEKPQGGRDDRIDSFILATLPFLEVEKKEFRSYLA